MDYISRLCELLDEKKDKFLDYEEATQALLGCEVDDVEQYITRRGRLATEIDELDGLIKVACSQLPNGEFAMDISRVRVEFERVPGEYHCVFYAGQDVYNTIKRIMETEKQVMERLQALRDEALEGVKQNQNLPKIKKYLSDLGDVQPDNPLKSEKA